MCLTRHVSLSSSPFSPKLPCVWFSAGTHSRTLPSSPALPRSSPENGGQSKKVRTRWEGGEIGTSRAPPYDINCLGVLNESREIDYFAVFTGCFDLPELRELSEFMTAYQRGEGRDSSGGRTRTLLSPPAVANRPLPCFSKSAA